MFGTKMRQFIWRIKSVVVVCASFFRPSQYDQCHQNETYLFITHMLRSIFVFTTNEKRDGIGKLAKNRGLFSGVKSLGLAFGCMNLRGEEELGGGGASN
jgi:hypothetical protein